MSDPYQHWLDDAAQMGLMLYRMRNDSKRERLTTTTPPAGSGGPPRGRPVYHHRMPLVTPQPVPVVPSQPEVGTPAHSRDTTPRTQQALHTPTVATRHYTSTSATSSPGALYLPLD